MQRLAKKSWKDYLMNSFRLVVKKKKKSKSFQNESIISLNDNIVGLFIYFIYLFIISFTSKFISLAKHQLTLLESL